MRDICRRFLIRGGLLERVRLCFCASLSLPNFTLDMGGVCAIILLFGVSGLCLFGKHLSNQRGKGMYA